MRFGSVCSGIEAASVAWNPLGWHAAWFAEIERFPCSVLSHHYPDVTNYGDMTTLPDRILSGEIEAPDMLCGRTPCQAFSVAGQRRSLDDARGNLSLTFCEIADAIDTARLDRGLPAAIIFWENVPGCLNTHDNAFGCFLGQLVGSELPLSSGADRWPSAGVASGPKRKVAWRTLDAQFFGVPQRRRRVFVVASARKDFDPSKILFERSRVSGNPEQSAEERKGTAPKAERGLGRSSDYGRIVGALTASDYVKGGTCNQVVNSGQPIVEESFTQTSFANYRTGVGTIRASGGDLGGGSENLVLAVYENQRSEVRLSDKSNAFTQPGGKPGQGNPVVFTRAKVRKLTPRESERLQGFPDDYTKIPYRGKAAEDCPDSPRYKAIGNSWCVPCVRWIGERIKKELEK